MRHLTTFLAVLAFTTLTGMGGLFAFHVLGLRGLVATVLLMLAAGALVVFTAWLLRS